MAGWAKFINPYNFIPLGFEITKYKTPADGEKLYTGEISYSVETKTPLFIPGKVVKEEDEHKTIDFFSYGDDMPVISGSEIRGMFRSYYEILTNSCLSALDSDTQLSKRTSEPFKAGLLKKNGDKYELYEAEASRYKEYRDTKDEDEFKEYSTKTGTGIVLKGNRFLRKKWSHVISLSDNKETVSENVDTAILDAVLEEYKKNKNAYKTYEIKWKAFKTGNKEEYPYEYFPVYYSKNEAGKKTIIYLSPAAITREMYHNTIRDCVGSYAPCEDEKNLCPACALFGVLGKPSGIRFSDLQCSSQNQSNLYDDYVTLKELASPKLNNMEFYLKKPNENAWFWTYDYWVDQDGKVHFEKASLNGRKFYWHYNPEKRDYVTEEKTKRNTTVRPVKAGNTFSGKLFFKDISKAQLQQLVWMLNAGKYEEGEPELCYKLGAAKPLGFGSIKTTVDSIELREICCEDGTVEIRYNPADASIAKPDYCFEGNKEHFIKATSFDTIAKEKQVSYPYSGTRTESGYTWYVNNHKAYKHKKDKIDKFAASRGEMVFLQYMEAMEPELKDTDKVFPGKLKDFFEEQERKRQEKQQRGHSQNQRNNRGNDYHKGKHNNNHGNGNKQYRKPHHDKKDY